MKTFFLPFSTPGMYVAACCALTFVILTLGPTRLAAGATPDPREDNGWNPKTFSYTRPDHLTVEEATPVFNQINISRRAPQMRADAADPVPATQPATPLAIEKMRIIHLRFRDADGEVVPALLCKPGVGAGPFPVVVAVHGLYSNKAQVCWQVAPTLTARGFAVLAPDLPHHGERPGNPWEVLPPHDLDRTGVAKAFALQRRAAVDVRQCIDLAEARPDLDTRNGVVLSGYSMGSWVSSIVGAADPRVKAMVLMVGGALDIPAPAELVPQIAATDSRKAIAHFAGRPLLLLNGRHDRIVTPDMGERLFRAAPEPKAQQWYDSGHLLPMKAYADAAAWIAKTWKAVTEEAHGNVDARKERERV